MSESIDRRVVEMRFDNANFEQNAQKSISTLDKLKAALKLDGAAKGLSDVENKVNKFEMGGLGNAVEAVSVKFSAMEIAGITALANITNRAVDAGVRIGKALTVDPITTGLNEYETKMNAVQVIKSNTRGKNTLDDINNALEELNEYSDKTIYNFAQMTSNMGKFSAQGMDAFESARAIKGIANLAAASGASAEDMSRATYQMSQALGGTIRKIDWNSLRNANMATVDLKTTLQDVARASGVAIDEIIAKKGTFEDSLEAGWLTGDMFTEAMNMYSGIYTDEKLREKGYTEAQIKNFQELASMAESAATEVKTLTQLWDVLKETAQSGWTQSFELVFGNFDEAKAMFTQFQIEFSDILNASAESRNQVLKDWKALGGRNDLLGSLVNIMDAIKKVVSTIKQAFVEVFGVITGKDLATGTRLLYNFTEGLMMSDKAALGLKNAVKLILTPFKILFQILKSISSVAYTVINILVNISGYLLELAGSFNIATGGLDGFLSSMNTAIVNGLITALKFLAMGAAFVANKFMQLYNALSNNKYFVSIKEQIKSIFNHDNMSLGEGFLSILGMIKNAIVGIATVIGGNVILPALDSITGAFIRMKNAIMSFSITEAVAGVIDRIKDALERLSKIDKAVLVVFGFSAALIALAVAALRVVEIINNVTGGFADAAVIIAKSVKMVAKTAKMYLAAKALKEFAISVAIVAAAIAILCNIPYNNLWQGITVMAVAGGIVTALSIALSKLAAVEWKSLFGAAGVAGALSLSLLSIAFALRILANNNIVSLATIENLFLAVTTVVALATIAAALSKNSVSFSAGAISMLILSFSLVKVGTALKQLEGMDFSSLRENATVLLGGLVALALVAFASSKIRLTSLLGILALMFVLKQISDIISSIPKGSVVIPDIVTPMKELVTKFSNLIDDAIALKPAAIAKLALIFITIKIALAAVFLILPKLTALLTATAASMAALALLVMVMVMSISYLITVMSTLEFKSKEAAISSAIALGAASAAMYVLMKAATDALLKCKDAVISIGSFAAGIGALALGIAILVKIASSIDEEASKRIWRALLPMGIIAAGLTTMISIISYIVNLSKNNNFSKAAKSIVAMTFGIGVATLAVAALSILDTKKILGGAVALSVALAGLGYMIGSISSFNKLKLKGIGAVFATMLTIAGFIGLMVPVFYVIQKYDYKTILAGGTAISIMALAISTAVYALQQIKTKTGTLKNMAKTVGSMAAQMWAIALAIDALIPIFLMFKSMNYKTILSGAVAVGIMTVALSKAATSMSSMSVASKNVMSKDALGSLVASMLALAISMDIVYPLFAVFGKMNVKTILSGAVAIAIVSNALALAVKVLSSFDAINGNGLKPTKVATVMSALSASMDLMIPLFAVMSTMDPKQILAGAAGISVMLLALTTATRLAMSTSFSNLRGKLPIKDTAAIMASLAGVTILLVPIFLSFSNLSASQILSGAGSIVVLMTAIEIVSTKLATFNASTGAISLPAIGTMAVVMGVLAGVMNIFIPLFNTFSQMKPGQIIAGAGGITMMVGAIGGIVSALELLSKAPVDYASLALAIAAMIGVAAAIYILAPRLAEMSKVNILALAESLIVLGVALGVLAAGAYGLGQLITKIPETALGLVILAALAGILLLVAGAAVVFANAISVAAEPLGTFIGMIGNTFITVLNALEGVVSNLIGMLQPLAVGIQNVAIAFGTMVSNGTPSLVGPLIGIAAAMVIMSVIGPGLMVTAGATMVLGTGINLVSEAIITLKATIDSVLTSLAELAVGLAEVAGYCIEGFAGTASTMSTGIFATGASWGVSFIDGMKAALGIHSPSRACADVVKQCTEGSITQGDRDRQLIEILGVETGNAYIQGLESGMSQIELDTLADSVEDKLFEEEETVGEKAKKFGKDILDKFKGEFEVFDYSQIEKIIEEAIGNFDIESMLNISLGATITIGKVDGPVMKAGDARIEKGKTLSTYEMSQRLQSANVRYEKSTNSFEKLFNRGFLPKDASESVNKLTEDLGGLSEGLDDVTGSGGKAKDSISDLASTIEGAIDIFSKFEKKTDMTADQMLENMRSQVEGVRDWAHNIALLSTKGIDQGLLKKLGDMGPKSYEYVNAFVNMSADQLAEANQLFAESLELPSQAASVVENSYAIAGAYASEGFANGIDAKPGTDAAVNMALQALNGLNSALDINSPSKETFKSGEFFDMGLGNGIESEGKYPRAKLTILCRELLKIVEDNFAGKKAKEAGMNFVKGIAEGISDTTTEESLLAKIKALAKKMVGTLNKNLDEHSPSRLTEKSGANFMFGLGNGITNNSDYVVNSVRNSGNRAIKMLQETLEGASDSIDEGLNLNPTIRPVLDLTEIQNGANQIDSMMSTAQAAGMTSSSFGNYMANAYAASQTQQPSIEQIVDKVGEKYAGMMKDAISGASVHVTNNVALKGDANGIFSLVREQNSREVMSSGQWVLAPPSVNTGLTPL